MMGQRKGDDEYIARRATGVTTKLGHMKMVFMAVLDQSLDELDQKTRENMQDIHEYIAHSMNTGAAVQAVAADSAVGESSSSG